MGENCGIGKDHTIFSKAAGWVHFKFDRVKKRQVVGVSTTHNPNQPKKTREPIADLLNDTVS